MIKISAIGICAFLLVINCFYCSNGTLSHKPFPFGKKFIPVESIEKAGFEHFNPLFFRILITKKYIYLLNSEDKMIARFTGENADKIYNHPGQGPGEALNPTDIFLIKDDEIAVFDGMKSVVLFFDFNLNFKKEIKVSPLIRKISKINGQIVTFGDFANALFAHLDTNFNKVDSFGEKKRKVPFKNLYPTDLYMGYILNCGDVANTSWLYVYPRCKIDIIDAKKKYVKLSLEWKNPYPPDQKSITLKQNMYSSFYVGKYGGHYVVQNSFDKNLRHGSVYDLILFDESGKLLQNYSCNGIVLEARTGIKKDSLIYFIDDDCNIYRLEVDTLL